MTIPLRDRLAKILASAHPSIDFPPWDSPWERDRDHWREVADALLASEEWQAREAVVEAAKELDAYMGPHASPLFVWSAFREQLARLDAGKEEGR